MADKLLISVSANQVSVGRWQGGRLVACTVFPNGEDGIAGLKEHLASGPRVPVHFMVDAVEED